MSGPIAHIPGCAVECGYGRCECGSAPAPTLTEFLLARIDEDEALAKASGPDGGDWSSRYPELPDCHMYGDFGWTVSGPDVQTEDSEWGKHVADHIARHDPARVLAECEAKRRIVENHLRHEPGEGGYGASRHAVRLLAAVYSDHPDYDKAWRS